MPEPAAPARKQVRIPQSLAVLLLGIYVLVDAALWIAGSYYLMLDIEHLPEAGMYLTLALVVMLFGGWLWRWLVAMGWIGGRPTARFGGA